MKEQTKRCTSIGGQAVMEGVMMRGSKSMALAVRDPDGEVQLETYRVDARKWYNKIPVIRGMASFVSSLVIGMKMLTRSTEISSTEEESIGKGGVAFAMIFGVLLAVGLFIVLPEFLAGIVRKYLLENATAATRVLLYSLTGGVIRIVIFILYLVFCSKLGDIRRTFMYHGAEHKTINCFESGEELTIENIQKCTTIHRRCGTTFLFLVMMISILMFAFANWFFEVQGLGLGDSEILQNITRMLAKLILMPFIAGFAYEVLKLFAKLPYNLFTKIIMAPGLALQKLTTAQPDDDMVEVALKSFLAVLEMDADPSIPEIKFYEFDCADFIKKTAEKLRTIGAEDAEAYWIVSEATGVSRSGLATKDKINEDEYKKIRRILNRRLEGEPLDYILGVTNFYGLKIKVTPDVLIPRMDTETLAEQAIIEINKRKESCAVLDLCTGSGCISAAIMAKTTCRLTASDISEDALKIAAINLEGKGAEIIQSNLFQAIDKKFDLIVSNPPYIKSGDIAGLQTEVTCQPRLALDGGEDGLDFYRRIIEDAPNHLNEGGKLLLEIGHDQAAEVLKLLAASFKDIEVIKDLSGSDRVVKAELK